jgi:hypothetical protein
LVVKAFKLSVEEGTLVVCFVERSKGVYRVVFLGKIRLLAIVEAMVKGDNLKGFVRTSRVGSKSYIT